MKIATAAEMSAIDRATVEHHGVDSLTLMENAGAAVAEFAREHWPSANRIVVVCGRGNNGGDGLVAARRLHEARKVVEVLLLGPAEQLKADAVVMLTRLPVRPIMVGGEEISREHVRSLAGAELIVDAIYGTGYKPRSDASPTRLRRRCCPWTCHRVGMPTRAPRPATRARLPPTPSDLLPLHLLLHLKVTPQRILAPWFADRMQRSRLPRPSPRTCLSR